MPEAMKLSFQWRSIVNKQCGDRTRYRTKGYLKTSCYSSIEPVVVPGSIAGIVGNNENNGSLLAGRNEKKRTMWVFAGWSERKKEKEEEKVTCLLLNNLLWRKERKRLRES